MTINNRKRSSKSNISAGRPRSYSELYKNDKTAPSTVPAVTGAKAQEPRTLVSRSSEVVDWKSEYAYVLSDLRLLGIVSASLLAIIVVVGFFI